jgi:hypothetical protein
MDKSEQSRRYPPLYEKVIPVLLWVLGLVIIILMLVTVAVAVNFIGTT